METRPRPTAGGTGRRRGRNGELKKALVHVLSTAERGTRQKHADLHPNRYCSTRRPAILTGSSALPHPHIHLHGAGVPDPSVVPLPASR